MDSGQLSPLYIKPAKLRGFVLSSGAYPMLCRHPYDLSCSRYVSEKRCPPGYMPSVVTALVGGGGSVGIRRIFLQPQPGILMPYNDGYMLRFQQGYIQNVATAGTSPITINYSVYCG